MCNAREGTSLYCLVVCRLISTIAFQKLLRVLHVKNHVRVEKDTRR